MFNDHVDEYIDQVKFSQRFDVHRLYVQVFIQRIRVIRMLLLVFFFKWIFKFMSKSIPYVLKYQTKKWCGNFMYTISTFIDQKWYLPTCIYRRSVLTKGACKVDSIWNHVLLIYRNFNNALDQGLNKNILNLLQGSDANLEI